MGMEGYLCHPIKEQLAKSKEESREVVKYMHAAKMGIAWQARWWRYHNSCLSFFLHYIRGKNNVGRTETRTTKQRIPLTLMVGRRVGYYFSNYIGIAGNAAAAKWVYVLTMPSVMPVFHRVSPHHLSLPIIYSIISRLVKVTVKSG